MMNANQIKQLEKIGSDWKKNEMHRIYINDIAELYGMHPTYSQLNSIQISNTKAGRIRVTCAEMKLWYDFSDDKFHCKTDVAASIDEIFQVVVAKIYKSLIEDVSISSKTTNAI
jgi:hypothetical protein